MLTPSIQRVLRRSWNYDTRISAILNHQFIVLRVIHEIILKIFYLLVRLENYQKNDEKDSYCFDRTSPKFTSRAVEIIAENKILSHVRINTPQRRAFSFVSGNWPTVDDRPRHQFLARLLYSVRSLAAPGVAGRGRADRRRTMGQNGHLTGIKSDHGRVYSKQFFKNCKMQLRTHP